MKLISFSKAICLKLIILVIAQFPAIGQDISDYKIQEIHNLGKFTIKQHRQFNGYTNYWHNDYTQWHRYGNLFKIAFFDLQHTILQSKIDIEEDMGFSGLLMQEGFISSLINNTYKTIEDPALNELENTIGKGNTLVITNPTSNVGYLLDQKSNKVLEWAGNLPSH